MTLLAPAALFSLLVIPVVALSYVALVRRRRTTRPAALEILAPAWKRHLPSTLFLFALTGLLFSLARPEATVALPSRTGTMVLAVDTSNSMLADDVTPTRLGAAKLAANRLVDRQPASIQIGVVAFTDGGVIVQHPTNNQRDVRTAIEQLEADGGTSIGEGIFAALDAIVEGPISIDGGPAARVGNAAIVVLTDGEDLGQANSGQIAALAGNAGVPVYTVGFGTRRGTVVQLDGLSVATALNESILDDIAVSTGGSYFLAADDPNLHTIFDEIDRNFETQSERIEITALVAIAAMVLMIAAGGLSLRWFGRV